MVKKKNITMVFVAFVIKTFILFGFFYEYVPVIMPTALLSSRKIGLVVAFVYFVFKGYKIKPFLTEKRFVPIFVISLICVFYSLLLMQLNKGSGELVIVWYVFFVLYALLGSILFAGFFNWEYEKLLKAIAIVTLAQAIWCILTFYINEFRVLNSTLFVVPEEENIDFLTMRRLRSIGAAGAGLSVRLGLSSFSFLYFLLKKENIIFNVISLVISLFATFLAGTTGVLIFMVSLPVSMYLMMNGRRGNLVSSLLITISLLFLYVNTNKFFDDYQYDDLTYKLIGLFKDKTDDVTIRALTIENTVPNISLTTIVGTGLSRGRVMSGEKCNHDGGYFRNYFGIGLIMSILFYFILYRAMYRQCKGLPRNIHYLLLTYLMVCVVIEFKEPFIFSYIPLFIFQILVLAERQQLFKEGKKKNH